MSKRRRDTNAIRYPRLLAEIRKGNFSSLYLFVGEEAFLQDEALRCMIDMGVDPATRAFNLDVFYADQADPADVLSAAAAFPMIAPRRMVILKECEKLRESALERLLPLATSSSPSTVMIFVARKVDLRRKLFLEIGKAGVTVEFKRLYEDQVPPWIEERLRAQGKRISSDALRMLHLTAGSDLAALANEIEKICTFVGDREDVEMADVGAIAGQSKVHTIFNLTDAVGRRNIFDAQNILNFMLERGESESGILAMIARHLLILLRAKELTSAKLPRSQLAGKLKVPAYFLTTYLTQADLFSTEELAEGLHLLLDAEDRTKGGRATRQIGLQLLVHRLCRLRLVPAKSP